MNQTIAMEPIHKPKPVLAALQQTRHLGFDIRVIGQSQALIFPQRIGNWWMQPYQPGDNLPSRAQMRLQALLDAGLKPKAVVVFHEIPTTHSGQSSRLGKATRNLVSCIVVWAQQEFPVWADQTARAIDMSLRRAEMTTRKYAPVVARVLVQAAVVAEPIMATVAMGALLTTAAIGAALLHDPCLVLVTEDGYWIEVDRWDE